jgi:endonuclease/exonuclease/phosphatase family metal-dependent hydrolase
MWAPLLLGSALLTSSTSVVQMKVMTYNVRYMTAEDGDNAWPYRKESLFALIREHDPDVLGLQEALKPQLDEIMAAAPGYKLVGVGRDDGREAGEYAALLLKENKFVVLEQGVFWLSDTPEVPGSRSWGNNVTRICTWAKVRFGDTLMRLACTHWDHESQESRERSGLLIPSMIPSDLPWMLLGDFNVGLSNPALKILLDSGLRDSWRDLNPDAKEPATFTGFSKEVEFGDKIDDILISKQWAPTAAGIDRRTGGASYPSDHFPVWATLKLD